MGDQVPAHVENLQVVQVLQGLIGHALELIAVQVQLLQEDLFGEKGLGEAAEVVAAQLDDFEVGVGGPERCRYVGQLAIFKLQMFQLLHGGEAEAGLRVLIEDAGDVGQVVPR